MKKVDEILDDIDTLVDDQMAGGEGYVSYSRCPHCGGDWHGFPITERVVEMRGEGVYDEEYSVKDDTSTVLCAGSDAIGPQRLQNNPITVEQMLSFEVMIPLLDIGQLDSVIDNPHQYMRLMLDLNLRQELVEINTRFRRSLRRHMWIFGLLTVFQLGWTSILVMTGWNWWGLLNLSGAVLNFFFMKRTLKQMAQAAEEQVTLEYKRDAAKRAVLSYGESDSYADCDCDDESD